MATLGLSVQESALLLGINTRTIHRWLTGEVDIPQSIERVIEAWSYLNNFGLPWRPDGHSISLLNNVELRNQMFLNAEHSLQLAEILESVKRRGGAAAPWSVDLVAKKATLGDIWVSFYILPNGTFSPQSYGRYDKFPDTLRDESILKDAYACIAEALAERQKLYLETDWSSVEI